VAAGSGTSLILADVDSSSPLPRRDGLMASIRSSRPVRRIPSELDAGEFWIPPILRTPASPSQDVGTVVGTSVALSVRRTAKAVTTIWKRQCPASEIAANGGGRVGYRDSRISFKDNGPSASNHVSISRCETEIEDGSWSVPCRSSRTISSRDAHRASASSPSLS